MMAGVTGFEPATSAVTRQRSGPAELHPQVSSKMRISYSHFLRMPGVHEWNDYTPIECRYCLGKLLSLSRQIETPSRDSIIHEMKQGKTKSSLTQNDTELPPHSRGKRSPTGRFPREAGFLVRSGVLEHGGELCTSPWTTAT